MDTQRRPETPLQASGSLASGADRELLARYQATGDQDALGEIVRRHARLVYAACLRVLGDHHAAEDAAQAAFVTFCRRARHLSDEGSLRAWRYETTRLTAVVYHLERSPATVSNLALSEDLARYAAKKDRAPRWLGNGNAGWSAEVHSAEIKLTDAAVSGTMQVKVTYFGFRDGMKDDSAYHRKAFDAGLSFLAYWNTSEEFLGRPTPRYSPYPHYLKYTPYGEHIEYVTSSKPVAPGQYAYRFDGRRWARWSPVR
jgi:hypothetical protein